MSIIADISVVLAWRFEEKQTEQALDVLRLIEREGLLVPSLWWSELENGILMGERRGRTTAEDSAAFVKLVRALPIRTDAAPRHQISDDIIDIGRRHQLTAYDAAYVELAMREGAVLASFDAAIRRCANKLKLMVLPATV
ncbi:MAG: type II toxin-antitoxin system VapC family toxin [Planctomycetia bacterium]|nr:type II toxin-antitoxin system VapC family toxin [Planctomycetia bacterium]